MPSARGEVELSGWNEEPVAEHERGKVTRASVTQTARGELRVVPDSATGAPAGLRGGGKCGAPTGPVGTFTLDHDLG